MIDTQTTAEVRALTRREVVDRLPPLFERFWEETGQVGDTRMLPYALPFDSDTYQIFGLFVEGRLVGFQDAMHFYTMTVPFHVGSSQVFYVEPFLRQYAPRLLRTVHRWFQAVGAEEAWIVSSVERKRFWVRHRFLGESVLLKRRV